MLTDPFHAARLAADRLAKLSGVEHHDVAVVLGSGWMGAADQLGAANSELTFGELGGFAPPGVAGHLGTVRSLSVGDRNVLAVMGRVHLYEGHEPDAVVHGVRMAVLAGCSVVVLTNAAGGLRPGMAAGDVVLIRDHINLTGQSPMSGAAPLGDFGSRFVDLTDAYSPRLRALAVEIDHSLTDGVYCGLPGPHYETPAEVDMIRRLGGDLVGMSTVLETIAARHLDAEVLGLSLVTNLAAGVSGTPLDHGEVLAAGQAAVPRLGELLLKVVSRL